jgi:hypothetical protein
MFIAKKIKKPSHETMRLLSPPATFVYGGTSQKRIHLIQNLREGESLE